MKQPLIFIFTLVIMFLSVLPVRAQEAPQLADKIVAHVNDHIILKSEIDQSVADYLRQAQFNGQDIEFTKGLWFSFLESAIDNFILLEKAKIDSITVTDDQVDSQMQRRIDQLIRQAGSERALEQAFGKSLIQIKADFREDFREQIIVSQIRQQKLSTIDITRPEVREFFEAIPQDSLPTIPEQVALSQIVIIPPAKDDAEEEAYNFAQQLRDSLVNHNVSFEALARRHSDDPSSSRGGLLPMMDLNELVPEYSAAASALEPGGISKVVETEYGYHIIRLNKRVGDQIETNHILIRLGEEELDDEFAIQRLNAIRDSILTNDNINFAEMARLRSDDPNTANAGGKIYDPQTQERLIPLNRLDPNLYRIVLLMDEEGTISEPRPFNPQNGIAQKAYRIVQLNRQIPEHVANLEQDFERIKQIALQEKQIKVMNKWLDELRNDFYVKYNVTRDAMEGS